MTVARLLFGGDGEGSGRSAGGAAPPLQQSQRRLICYDKLIDLLYTVDWSTVESQNDVSIAYDLFENQLLGCIAACTYDVTANNKIKKLKPWIIGDVDLCQVGIVSSRRFLCIRVK